jgi:hypothetical protein
MRNGCESQQKELMNEKRPTEIEGPEPDSKLGKFAKKAGILLTVLKGFVAFGKELLDLFKSWKGML